MGQTDKFRDAFCEEAKELLTELEAGLLELEERPDEMEVVGRVFRAMHTIKGSGAMFGFDQIASFTHEVETVFDKVRNGEVPVSKELIGITLVARDVIRAMLDVPPDGTAELQVRADEIVGLLRSFLPGAPPAEETPSQGGEVLPPKAQEPARVVTYRILFRPRPELFQSGTDPVSLLRELGALGHCKVVARTKDIPRLRDLDPELCYAGWDAILTSSCGRDAIRDVFIFVEDQCELRIEVIDDGADLDTDASYKRLGEILVERGDLKPEDLQEVLKAQKRIGDVLKETGLVHDDAITSALAEQKVVREVRAKRESSNNDAGSSIRVPAEKLDSLVDLVGELVIAQARLSQIAGGREDPELLSIAEEIERLSAELRDNTLNVRMLPIGTTFSKFRRLVRDLSGDLGKEIELVTEGAETELDKTVIERLGDPLVHLIRNSVDHGIESPEARSAAGKPARGTVRLSAYHSGPNVFIEIADDGVGLDPEAIRAKALEKGLIPAEAKLSDKELFGLIFLPGFSTAKTVSNVSGRGVGMDVVKRSIDALRGSIEIESKRAEGTRIRIKLPLTLAIIEGLLVSVGAGSFVLPLSLVEECVELSRADVTASHGRQIANVRGELVPYIRLREWFATDGDSPSIEQIVIAGVEGSRFGFVVDSVVGQHQTVIKTLGRMYQQVDGLSGATILGDGTVALILDAPKLIRTAMENEVRH